MRELRCKDHVVWNVPVRFVAVQHFVVLAVVHIHAFKVEVGGETGRSDYGKGCLGGPSPAPNTQGQDSTLFPLG